MSCTSCEPSTSCGSTSQVFRILPRSGMMAWNSRSRACLAEPPAESPSTRNSSVSAEVLAGAVGELAGERRAGGHRLALDLLAGAQARLWRCRWPGGRSSRRRAVCWLSQRAKASLRDAGDEGRRLARGEALLGLAGELRVLHAHARGRSCSAPRRPPAPASRRAAAGCGTRRTRGWPRSGRRGSR